MTQDALEPISALPRGEFAFPGPLRDALVAAILNGTKTKTTSLLAEYPHGYKPQEDVGNLEAVLDSHDNVVCVIRTTEVQVCRLADVSDEHAITEGEGYTDASEWWTSSGAPPSSLTTSESLTSTMTPRWCASVSPSTRGTRPAT